MRLACLTMPLLLFGLAACSKSGQADRNVMTTNSGDVLLNEAQANYAIRNDNEQVAAPATGSAAANGSGPANGTTQR